jgi:hypothetical protein
VTATLEDAPVGYVNVQRTLVAIKELQDFCSVLVVGERFFRVFPIVACLGDVADRREHEVLTIESRSCVGRGCIQFMKIVLSQHVNDGDRIARSLDFRKSLFTGFISEDANPYSEVGSRRQRLKLGSIRVYGNAQVTFQREVYEVLNLRMKGRLAAQENNLTGSELLLVLNNTALVQTDVHVVVRKLRCVEAPFASLVASVGNEELRGLVKRHLISSEARISE